MSQTVGLYAKRTQEEMMRSVLFLSGSRVPALGHEIPRNPNLASSQVRDFAECCRGHVDVIRTAALTAVASFTVGGPAIGEVGDTNPLIAVATTAINPDGDGDYGVSVRVVLAAMAQAGVEPGAPASMRDALLELDSCEVDSGDVPRYRGSKRGEDGRV